MTVPVETSEIDYVGDASATSYPVPFPFTNVNQIVATLLLAGDSVASTLTLGVHYSLIGALSPTGTLTMVTPPPAGSTLHIERTVPIIQATAFRTQGNFSPATHENAFDYRTFVDQQLDRRLRVVEALADLTPVDEFGSIVVTKQFTTPAEVEAIFPLVVNIPVGITPTGILAVRMRNLSSDDVRYTDAAVTGWTFDADAGTITLEFITGLAPSTEYVASFFVLTQAPYDSTVVDGLLATFEAGAGGRVSSAGSVVTFGTQDVELSGQTTTDGFSTPSTSELIVYVQSALRVQQPEVLQPTLGNDANDGLSKARPLLSMDGVRKMVARRGIAGKRIVVRLAGGGYPEVADPWDGQCTSIRYYLVRDLFIGGSEAFANSWCVEGPRKMTDLNHLGIANPTVTTFGGDGLRTRWQTAGLGVTAGSLKSQWVRVTRGGREVTPPMQITDNTTTDFWTDNGPNTPGSVYEISDTFEFVACAAELVPTNFYEGDVAAADGLAMQGAGAAVVHDRPGALEACRNPRQTFSRIAFERLNTVNVGGISFDTCLFYNTASFRGGWVEFVGCIANCASGVEFLSQTRRVSPNDSETNEYNGRATVVDLINPPGTSLTADPIWPGRGGIGLYITQGGLRVGSEHAPGFFRIWKGLSVAGGIIVQGPGSALVQPTGINILFSRDSAQPGLWCRWGAMALIDDAAGLVEMVNVTGHLKVGVGAAIALGTGAGAFRQVGQWAGNFSRHLEVNGGGKPTGDFSRIADSGTWF